MSSPVLIIAEAGVNHNGSVALAKQLIDVAAEAGADYVKFQTFKAAKLVSKAAQKADYQKNNTQSGGSQLEMLQKLELSEADHYELLAHCAQKNIAFLSTGFDVESIDFLQQLGIDLWKVPSGELTNFLLLRKIGGFKQQVIVSTGMATLDEIEAALQVLVQYGTARQNITVLHCNTEYPTPFSDVNLRAMQSIAQKMGVNIGYSDHTLGTEVPIAAVALGATIIEKHFTLSRQLEGPDHAASLEPAELKAMVSSIRNIEKALGSDVKEPTESEKKNTMIARKSIVASQNIKKGEILTEQNLTVKRPADGISPMRWNEIVGQTATRDYAEDELIVAP